MTPARGCVRSVSGPSGHAGTAFPTHRVKGVSAAVSGVESLTTRVCQKCVSRRVTPTPAVRRGRHTFSAPPRVPKCVNALPAMAKKQPPRNTTTQPKGQPMPTRQPISDRADLIKKARRLLSAENFAADPFTEWNTDVVLLAAITVELGRIADALEAK